MCPILEANVQQLENEFVNGYCERDLSFYDNHDCTLEMYGPPNLKGKYLISDFLSQEPCHLASPCFGLLCL